MSSAVGLEVSEEEEAEALSKPSAKMQVGGKTDYLRAYPTLSGIV